MAGSNTLLGRPKSKKKSTQKSLDSTSVSALSADMQAKITVRLFVEDVSGRIKSLLRRRKSASSKLFTAFLTKLSQELDPIQTLTALNLDAFKDFLSFLTDVQTNLMNSPANAAQTYQLLTENLESTAQFLSQSLGALEASEENLSLLDSYVYGRIQSANALQAPSDNTTKHEHALPPELPSEEASLSEEPISFARFGKRKVYYFKSAVNTDFGFSLSSFFLSNGYSSALPKALPKTTRKPIKQETSFATPPTDKLKPVMRDFFKQLSLFIDQEVLASGLSSLISDTFQKISASFDVIEDLKQFESLDGVKEFLEFAQSLNNDSASPIDQPTVEQIAKHLSQSFTSALAEPLMNAYLSTPSVSDVADAIDSLQSEYYPESEEVLPQISTVQDLTREIESVPEPTPPLEVDYIAFAKKCLNQAKALLISENASQKPILILDALLRQADVLTSLAQSDIQFLRDFADFLGQSWVNQTPVESLNQHESELSSGIAKSLKEDFSGEPQSDVDSSSFFDETDALDVFNQAAPIKEEESEILQLPNISNFLSDVETDIDQEPTNPQNLVEEPTAPSLPDLSDFSFVAESDGDTLASESINAFETERPPVNAEALNAPIDYAFIASNFLRQVVLSLPNSKTGLAAQTFLQRIIDSDDILYALVTSNQRGLVDFAHQLEQSKLANEPLENLISSLSEQVGFVAGALMLHFGSQSLSIPEEDEDDSTSFSFSDLVPPSAFSQNPASELDEDNSPVDSNSSFDLSQRESVHDEQPQQEAILPTESSLLALQPPSEAIGHSESSQASMSESDTLGDMMFQEDGLILDDSLANVDDAPTITKPDELKFAPLQSDIDFDIQSGELLLPEENFLGDSETTLLSTPSELSSSPNKPPSLDFEEPLLDDEATVDLKMHTPPIELTNDLDHSIDDTQIAGLSVSNIEVEDNPTISDLPSLDFSESDFESLPAETIIDPPLLNEASQPVASNQDLNFDDSMLFDESMLSDSPQDLETSKEQLSALKSLSAKSETSDDGLSLGDTLDESFLTDSPMMLDDAPSFESDFNSISTESSPDLSIDESILETAGMEMAALDTTLLEHTESFNSLESEVPAELPNLSFEDHLSFDDSLETRATQTESSAMSSFSGESYESELAPVGDFTLDEIQQIFLDEAREYIEKLNEDMLELDKHVGTAQPDLVNRALRGAHTLKGSAAMVSLNNIRDLGHKMEDCLQVVRDNNLKVPRPLLDVLFKSLDAIGIMVQNFQRTGEDRFTKAQPLVDTLIAYTKQLEEFGEIRTAVSGAASSGIDAPPEEEVSSFQPDELQQIFLDEAKEYLDKLNEDMLELDKHIGTEQPDLVNRVLRGSHTLKGSAAMVSLKNIADLAHKMEDCLQVVRDNNLKVPRPLLDVLFKSSDAVGTMLKKFRSTGKDTLDVSRFVQVLKDYTEQLQKHGEIKNTLSIEAQTQSVEQSDAPKKAQTVAEQTVRIDIKSLNNLVNMSAELVISRNRLTNELMGVTRMINKFMKERNQLAQVNKKIITTIQKNQGESANAGTGFSDVLKEFSDTEFDRFSDLDIISRDVRSAMLNLDETINELRGLSSILGQNVVKVSSIANDLNREIVGMRMVPVKQMYTRFQRSVRDIAQKEEKEINLITEGEDTKLDKSVMEEVVEPVMHMVRNAIGHGIEKPDVRLSRGKSRVGTLTMRSFQKGSRVILEIEDDGGGIPVDKVKAKAVRQGLISQADADAMPPAKATELIFLPGFSTAEKVTELSGRGVGMDVVKNTIRQLKGTVNVETREGKGSKFIISLPLTLAINQALLVGASDYTYAIPLELVLETSLVSTDFIETDDDGKRTIKIRGEQMEFRYLNEILGYDIDSLQFKASLSVVVIGLEDRKVAIAVETLKGKDEIVVKSLGRHLRNVRGIIGATILGDGQVVVILDIEYLLRPVEAQGSDVYVSAQIEEPEPEEIAPAIAKRKRKGAKITVLHADDSPSVRKYVQSILKGANFEVISADDGLNALNRLPTANADLIVSDLEMPRMNGFEFVTEVRKLEAYKDIPFIIVTARAGDKHRRTGLELGANAFLNKPFDPSQLIETIESYIA